MNKNVVYIHGAFSDPSTFSTIITKLPKHNNFCPTYNAAKNPFKIAFDLAKQIDEEFGDEPITIVGHSFGGLISAWFGIINPEQITKVISIASPWAGINHVNLLHRLFKNQNILKYIHPRSDFIRTLQNQILEISHTNIVAVKGVILVGKRTDGIVTAESQESVPKNFTNSENYHVQGSHTNVLKSSHTIEIIRNSIYGWPKMLPLKESISGTS